MAKLVHKNIDVPFLLYYVSTGVGSTCPFSSLHLKQHDTGQFTLVQLHT